LPHGPVGPASTWAATLNVEVDQTSHLTPLTGEGYGSWGERGVRYKVTKRRRGKEGEEWGSEPGALGEGWTALLGYLCPLSS